MTDLRIQVAVPGPFYTPLTYLSERPLAPGVRVRVPLGPRRVVGVVLGEAETDDVPAEKLRPVQAVLDSEPALDAHQLALARWLARYYHAPIGEVVQQMLPVPLRAGKALWQRGETEWRLTEAGRGADVEALPPRAVRQRRLLTFLQREGAATVSRLRAFMEDYRDPMRALERRGWVAARQRGCLDAPTEAVRRHELNAEQRAIVEAVPREGFSAHLIEGVTGSGKTAVYLELVARTLAVGRQALVLVPEIGLTPQMVARFTAWLGEPVAVLHSGLSDGARHCAWTQLARGEARVALGTRSALLGRFANLGLIVVDEEHDASYKQQEGVRYSARDAALWLAHRLEIPVVLGSATPSLESLQRARGGRLVHHRLTRRATGAALPEIGLLDIRGERIEAGVSAPLAAAMREHLTDGGQVMLMLNRRGYAPVLMCHHCGWQADCPACSAHMTYHARPEQLRCHHCDAVRPVPERCPHCGSGSLVAVGQGTARLEEVLAETFDVPVVRIDRDSTRRRGALEACLEQVHGGEPMILLGTQMLAKGHHFPAVTLVGMLELDQGLFSPYFRATERLAQLVIQTAGRAGRE
uniref:replication restart helicase PriA n=1 Tax=Sulfurivirga sp. TaxID=2614236 RepID=UPI0025E144EA